MYSVMRIGSRESALAVKQAEIIKELIEREDPAVRAEIITMKTTGDKILDRNLDQIGGKGLFVRGHMWPVRNDAYEMMINSGVLTDTYVMMATELEQMVNYFGLSTAIYTQTTDVEHEINGLVTYDRRVEKMSLDKVREINTSVIEATRRK